MAPFLKFIVLKVEITDGSTRDVYRLPVGIRTIRWTNTQLLLNEKPVYIRGVGKHEDSDVSRKIHSNKSESKILLKF